MRRVLQILSSTSADTWMSRPCSSHVYQVTLTPASAATSSRGVEAIKESRRRVCVSNWRWWKALRMLLARISSSSSTTRMRFCDVGAEPSAGVRLTVTEYGPSFMPRDFGLMVTGV